MLINKKILQKISSKVKDLLKTLLPSNLLELFVFLGFFFIYGSLAFYIAQNFRIVFDNRIPWDAYFSFDNRSIVLTGGGFERHPLSNYYFNWLRKFALWISGGQKDATFRIVLSLCSSLCMALTQIQIFKYLKNIIKLPAFLTLFLTSLFGLFVTPILLSFTPETYTYSLLALCAFNYYAALRLQHDERLSGAALSLGSLVIGGLTITNIIKVYLPVLFEKKVFISWKKFGNAVLRIGISVLVFVLLFLNRLHFNYQHFFTRTETQYEKFSKAADVPLWDMMYSWFFGGNILFASFITKDYHNAQKTFYYKAIFMDVYHTWAPYIVVGLLYGLVVWSYIKNFKNKLVQILMLSFFFDILIHCVLRFGLHTSYIYGGHFVYIIPWMLGWLLYAYRKQPKILSFLFSILAICFVYVGSNNLLRLQEFFEFLNHYYR